MSAAPIQVGSYQLGQRVGEGGSAEVFSARAPSGRQVALKLLGPHAELDDERARARFEREIELLAEIDHPNLVRLLDSGLDPELGPYLVTELIEGSNLRGHVGLGPDIAALMTAPIAQAAAALHRAGLVHRDLKPENVLLTETGRLVLIDLGLALRPGQTRFTEEGEVTGSLPYMAPEQIEGRPVDAAADVWALGVLLYELVCGERPFARERPSEEAAAILVGHYKPLEVRDERSDPRLSLIIDQCLARDPSARPSADEVAESLAALVDWCPSTAHSTERRRHLIASGEQLENIAAFRVEALRDAARRQATHEPLEAIRLLSRALAYQPETIALNAELRELETHAAKKAAVNHVSLAPASSPPSRRGVALALGMIALLGAAAIGLAQLPNNDEVAVLAQVSVETRPPQPPSVIGHITDALVGDLPERSPSDVAAKRVTSGMLNILGRSLAAERDADGNLIAKQGGPGERSNEELTIDVFGGMFDLIEQGMAANRAEAPRAKEAPSAQMTLPPPPGLKDNDPPRELTSALAPSGEGLVFVPGRTRDQLRSVLAEVRRQIADAPQNAELRVVEAMYMLASGDEKAGLDKLAGLRRSHPELALTHLIRAKIELRRGDLDAARAAVERALASDATAPEPLLYRGRIRFLEGQTRSAFKDLSAALAANNQSPTALAFLAELYAAVGDSATSGRLIRNLQVLTLDNKVGAVAVYRLARLCDANVSGACVEGP